MRALITVAAVLIALPAVAQTNKDRVPIPLGSKNPGPVGPTPPSLVVEPVAMMIATCDANLDGRTSRDELHACLAKSFAAIDTASMSTEVAMSAGHARPRSIALPSARAPAATMERSTRLKTANTLPR